MGKDRGALWEEVRKAYDRLGQRYNPIGGALNEMSGVPSFQSEGRLRV